MSIIIISFDIFITIIALIWVVNLFRRIFSRKGIVFFSDAIFLIAALLILGVVRLLSDLKLNLIPLNISLYINLVILGLVLFYALFYFYFRRTTIKELLKKEQQAKKDTENA
jgi:hypothetical protein